jgi:hypothetical protein
MSSAHLQRKTWIKAFLEIPQVSMSNGELMVEMYHTIYDRMLIGMNGPHKYDWKSWEREMLEDDDLWLGTMDSL